MGQNRKARQQERRSFALGLVRRILQRVASRDLDAYEGYAQVRAIYLDQSGLLEELKDLVGLVEDNSAVDGAVREQMVARAKEWLGRA